MFQTNKPDVQLAFNSKENIAVLTTTDGGFDFEDYGKVMLLVLSIAIYILDQYLIDIALLISAFDLSFMIKARITTFA